MRNKIIPHRSLSEQIEDNEIIFQASKESTRLFEQLKELDKAEYIMQKDDVRNGSKFYNSRNNKRKNKK